MVEPFIPNVEEDLPIKVNPAANAANPQPFIPTESVQALDQDSPQARLMGAMQQRRLLGDSVLPQDRSPRSGIVPSLLEGLGRGDNTFDQQIEVLAQNMFPDLYKANRGLAIQRFARDGSTNDILFVDLDGKVRPVTPDITGADTLGEGAYRTGMNVARGLTGNIEEAAAVPTEIFTAVATKSPAAGAVAGGAAASTASAGRKLALDFLQQQSRGGEFDFSKSLEKMDKLDVASDGALYTLFSAPGMLIGKMVQKLGGMNQLTTDAPGAERLQTPTPAGPTVAEQGAEAMETATRQGRTLTVGQATGDDSLLVMERVLGRMPATANRMKGIYEQQLKEIQEELTKKLLPRLNDAGDDLSEGVVYAMTQSAKQIIEKAKQARTAATTEFYRRAFNSGVTPNISSTLRLINSQLRSAAEGGAKAKSLNRVKAMLMETQGQGTLPGSKKNLTVIRDFQKLHDAKINLDGMIQDLVDNLEGSAGKTALEALEQVRSQLVGTLRAAHPEYNKGADLFQNLSTQIENLERGAVGVLSRMNATDVNPAKQLGRVFNAFQVSGPKVIDELRNQFKAAGNEKLFNAGFRAYLQSVFEDVAKRTAREKGAGALASFAGNMYNQVFKTAGQREAFKAGVSNKQTYRDFASFFNHLDKLSQTKAAGSQTATDMPIMAAMQGSVSKGADIVAKAGLNIPARLADWFRSLSIGNRAIKLADLYTTPAGQQALKNFRAIKPGTQASINALTKVALFMGYDMAVKTTSDRFGGDIEIDGRPAREAQ